ncbi:MAG: insulinase family protein [Porticoccaceae bacterium]
MKRLVVAFVCFLFVFPAFAEAPLSSEDIARSESDTSSYRYLVLPNELQVLLISDQKADKAAAALDVFVGSSSDPQQRQGLAHFLEHMLFLGTDKYPEPDEYQAFISEHGGQHNAYTSFEHTNYFFDINPADFELALDRFSRFFVAPLFNGDYVDREKNAVHSEYKARIKNDYRRQMDVFSQVVNPEHPAAKFSVGNLDTLADPDGKLRQDLLAFYKAHYSANRMALVVLAPRTLDELEGLVRDRFEAVPNFHSDKPEHGKPLFKADALPLLVTMQPVRELRELSVTFPMPAVTEFDREKPLSYLGNLVGHEGKGSLLGVLKALGWAESLRAGEGISDLSGSSFDITIGLTPAGYEHWQQVLTLVYDEIALVKKGGVDQWRFREQGALADQQFRYMELKDPVSRVSALATNLQEYPYVDVIRGPYRMDLYDQALIESMLGYLRPDNAMVMLMAPEVKTEQVTEKYQVPYGVTRLPALPGDIAAADQLALPEPNPYVPENLALKHPQKAAEPVRPALLVNQPQYRLWHYADDFYQVPKAQLYVAIHAPNTVGVKAAAMTDLYLRVVEETLNETSYEAALAGLRYGVNRRDDGIGLLFSGFDDKLPLLVNSVVGGLLKPDLSNDLIERLRQELIRHWNNSSKDTPYLQLMREPGYLLDINAWQPTRLAEALEPFDADTFRNFVSSLYQGASLEILASGNLDSAAVKDMAGTMASRLAAPQPSAWPERGITQVLPGAKIQVPMAIEHRDAGVLRYYQGRSDNVDETARFMVLRQIIKAPFFHELRTQQQLGYVVAAVDLGLDRVPGFGLLVQSPAADVPKLEGAVDKFVADFASVMNTLTDVEFDRHRAAILTGLKEKPKSLAEQSSRYWGSIDLRDYDFSRRQQLIAAVEKMDRVDVIETYTEVMVNAGYSMQLDGRDGGFMSGLGMNDGSKVYHLPSPNM